ncbi:MAG: hypothetical protein ABSH03_02170 [Candidatus Lustribacter sp.]|jgi:hypothetical protein
MFDARGALRDDWRAVLIKHSDRGYLGPIDRYRRIAAQLPPDVAQRISWDKAAVLYGVH